MGISAAVARSTLADANELRDWRIYFELAQRLVSKARALYVDEDFGVELANTVYALDATTIDLCLSMPPWAPFCSTKAAVKLRTLLDLRGSIPTFIHISDGKMHDVNVLDLLLIEAGAFYITWTSSGSTRSIKLEASSSRAPRFFLYGCLGEQSARRRCDCDKLSGAKGSACFIVKDHASRRSPSKTGHRTITSPISSGSSATSRGGIVKATYLSG